MIEDRETLAAVCWTCKWWRPDPTPNPAWGVCKRMPPTALEGAAHSGYKWPVTVFDDRCGEHTP